MITADTINPHRVRNLPTESTMYRAVVDRNASYNGIFVVAVKTTGIFCRPTCAAKKPLRRNVEFFAAPADAIAAGYRPCLRCRPLDEERPPEWVRGLLAAVEENPAARLNDADVRAMGIEPTRARAWFKRHYNMTFHAYQRARRLGTALAEVRNGEGVSRAARRSGFESESGFREAFAKLFGEPPGRGRGLSLLQSLWVTTPLGPMLAIASDEGLCLLEFTDRRGIERQIATLRKRFGGTAIVPGRNDALDETERQLGRYFEGGLRRFTVPLDLRGSEFQMTVWEALVRIPAGETRSYAEVASAVGRPGAHRAVARANGDNRIAIIVPCHRVIASDGQLSGYGGHVWRKRWLLEHEGAGVRAAESA